MPKPLHFALRAIYAFSMLRARTKPQPHDLPAVRSGDPLADRVLVIGNGPSHGWGVTTHQLALTGQLAASISSRTDRGCDIDLIGAEAMSVRAAMAWIGSRDLAPTDGIVLVLGTNDSLRLTPLAVWERELTALLDGLALRLRSDAQITLVGIPPMSSVGAFTGPVARLTARHRERLNDVTHHIAAARGISYLDLPMPEHGDGPDAAAARYHEFAEAIAVDLAPRIAQVRPEPVPRAYPDESAWAWSGTGAVVELARTGGDENLRRLAEKAQRSFGVELAVVSLVDGDRLYYGNNTDVMPESVPLELSFCKYTVESEAPVVIPDTGKDARFDDNPLVDMSFINFYAGYPLRATDGHVIGSFCLQGSQPRRESAIALDLLRQLALEAEEVLHGYEQAGPVPVLEPQTKAAMPAPTGAPVRFGV